MSAAPTAPAPSADAVPAAGKAPRTPAFLQRTRERVVSLWAERAIVAVLFLSSTIALLTTVAIFWTMGRNGGEFFQFVDLKEFLTGRTWSPDIRDAEGNLHFGSLPLLKGTLQIALGACVVGIPLGVGTAVYISEFASDRSRRLLKPAIEVLAGVPSIVFGLVALFVIAPWLQATFCQGQLFTALAASMALGVMVVPIIASISEDALRAVPRELREGAMALGATKWEATWKVTLPAARSGISAATILGFSRAVGETMVVTLVGGLRASDPFDWDYCQPAQTVTAFIANRAAGDLPNSSIAFLSIFAVGLLLFALTFAINVVAQVILTQHRRKYA